MAESYERIHRSNLIGMGVLPVQFLHGEGRSSLGLTGFETFDLSGLAGGLEPGQRLTLSAVSEDGERKNFEVVARVDTPNEVLYLQHGGILQYVIRKLL